MANSTNEIGFPDAIHIQTYATPISTVGTWTPTINTNIVKNVYLVSSGNQNDEANWNVTLGAGTWTFELFHVKGNNRGIHSVQLDGVEIGTIDEYNPSSINDSLSSITGVVVEESRVYELKLKMATKNASSSSYVAAVQGIYLRRTA